MPKQPDSSHEGSPAADEPDRGSELKDLRGLAIAPHNENADPSAAAALKRQRRAPRIALNVETGIDDHTSFSIGFCENLSTGGLFVSTYRLVPVGTKVALTFVLPDEHPLFVQGIVRWMRAPVQETSDIIPGLGIEFVDLGIAEAERIATFVEQRAPASFDG